MSDDKTLGQAIREARLAKGMSMGQLAAAVERSTASVRRWERDQGRPAETIIHQLFDVLDLEGDDYPAMSGPSATGTPTDAPGPISASMRATSLASASPPGATGTVSAAPAGWWQKLRDPDLPWLGYTRAALTVVTLLLLAWLLIWALGGLLEAVGEIWTAIWSGTS